MKIFNKKNIFKAIGLFGILVLFVASFTPAYADKQGDLKTLSDACGDNKTSVDERAKKCAQMDIVQRQIDVEDSFASVKDRIDAMIKNDPRRDSAKKLISDAEKAKDAFMNMKYDMKSSDSTAPDKLEYLSEDPYRSSEAFNKAEKDAINAITAVNRELIAPSKPNKDVQSGDLVNDFIPGLIRMLFRFASLAVLVSFIVSGVYFVVAFGEEARITKAKHMLYYSLIGFVFVVLAFAIVKAVTNINFFGII